MKKIFRIKFLIVILLALTFTAKSQLYTSVSGTTFCAGGNIQVSYAVDYLFQTDNIFTVQLSNSTGSFANPVSIGSFAGRVSNTVNCTLPANTSYGTGYRVRTIASDPATTGYDNGVNLTINAAPNPSISGSFAFCSDNTYQSYSTSSGSNLTYQWSVSGGTISGSSTGTSVNVNWTSNSGTITLNESNTITGCTASTTQNITVNPLPSPSISGNTTVCAASAQNYSTTSVAGTSYQWSVTGGTINGSSTSNNVSVTWGSGASGSLGLSETITATGCSASTSQTVTINPLPTPSISGNTSPCYGSTQSYSTPVVNGVTYQWTVTGGTVNGSSNGNSISVTWTAPSSGSITLLETINSTGCTASTSQFIQINPLPNPNISGTFVMCADNSTQTYTTLNTLGISYQWSCAGGTINGSATGTSVSITWNSSAGTVSLRETYDLSGCTASTSQTVTVNPVPTPSITGNNSVCVGTTQSYSTASVSGVSYLWSVTGGTLNGQNNGTSISVSWNSGSNGIVRLTETITATGCAASVSQNVTINPLPTPSITGTTVMCANQNTQTYSTPTVSGVSYFWSATNGTINGSNTNPSVSITWSGSTGTVSVSETVTATGCTASTSTSVTINPLPTPSISGTTVFCADNATQTYTAPTVSGVGYQWSVSGGTINGSPTGNSVNITWNSSTGTVSIAETITATGCTASAMQTVTMNPLPTPSISGNTSVCATSSQSYSTPSVGGVTYQWTVSGGTIVGSSTNNSVSVTWGSGTSGALTVSEVITATGCTNRTNQSITINPLPTPQINGSLAMCADNTTQSYSTPQVAGVNYAWAVTGGTINGSSNNNQVNVTWTSSSGTISITETITATGCIASTSRNVTVNPLPTPSFTGNVNVCTYSTQIYTAPVVAGIAYSWSANGGSINGSSSNNTVSITWGSGASGTVSLLETFTATGCTASTSQTISTTFGPNPSITGNTSVCAGSTNTYSANSGSGLTYQWSVNGGTINGSSTGLNVNVTWNSATCSVILVETITATGCMATATQNITINPLPVPQISGLFSLCADSKTQVYSANTNPNYAYQWSVSGGTISGSTTGSQITVTWTQNTGTIKLVETNTVTSCIDSTTQNINVNQLPTPSISGNFTSCQTSTQNYTTGRLNGISYQWSVTGGTIIGTSTDTLVTVNWTSSVASITLGEVFTATGCSATTTQAVSINPLPQPSIAGNNNVCAKSIQVYSTTPVAGVRYQWAVTNGTINGSSTTNSINVTWGTVPGSMTVTEIVTATNCTGSSTMNVNINPLPVPSVAGEFSVCVTTQHTYTAPLDPNLSYTWNITGGSVVSSALNVITILWTDVAGNIQLIEQNSNTGCIDSVSYAVTINPLPNPQIQGNFASCQSATEVYSLSSGNESSYQWSVTGGTIIGSATGNKITVTWGNPGTGNLAVTQTITTTGCTASTSQIVAINSLPSPAITGIRPVCISNANSVPYSAVSSTGVNNKWTVDGGVIDGSSTGNICYVFWTKAGTGTVTLTQTYQNTGCSGSTDFLVEVRDIPHPAIGGDFSTCANTVESYSTLPVANASYKWTAENGTIVSRDDSTGVAVLWTTPDVGTIRVEQTDILTGCKTSVSRDVTILRLPKVVILGPSKTCSQQLVQYSIQDTNDVDASWEINGGTIVEYKSFHTVVVNWSKKISGNITAHVINLNTNCTNSSTLDVSIYDPPVATFNGNSAVCQTQKAVYTADTVAGTTYKWDVEGSSTYKLLSQGKIEIQWNTVLTGKVTLTAINAANCTSILSKDVKVYPSPMPEITGDTAVCEGDLSKYSANDISGITNKWTVSGGTISGADNQKEVTISWGKAGTATVTLLQTFTETGCNTPTSTSVIINPKPAKPTISKNINVLTSSATNGNQWYLNGAKITGATAQSYDAPKDGIYSVQTTNQYGCISDMSDTVNFKYTGVEDGAIAGEQNDIIITPNPVTSSANIRIDVVNAGVCRVIIRNMFGEQITELINSNIDAGSYNLNFNPGDIPSGVYFCTLETMTGSVTVKFTLTR